MKKSMNELDQIRSPENRIVGGAYFVRHTTLPLDLAFARLRLSPKTEQ
jgi:hypothetical protein